MQGRHIAVFVVGVSLGAIIGSITAVALSGGTPPEPTSQVRSPADDQRLGEVFERALVRALERVRETESGTTSRRRPGADAPAATTDADATEAEPYRPQSRDPGSSPRRPPTSEPSPLSSEYQRDAAEQLGPKNVGRLQRLVVRTDTAEEERRRAWLFVSQASIARELGAPDSVVQNKNGTEEWEYWGEFADQDGEWDEDSLDFTFARGRVVSVSGFDPIPEE